MLSPEGRPAATERHAMKEAATKALMCFDTDGNGLDQTEFTEALQAFRFNRDSKKMRDTISNIFAKCDVDGNGRLTAKVRHPGLPWPRGLQHSHTKTRTWVRVKRRYRRAPHRS